MEVSQRTAFIMKHEKRVHLAPIKYPSKSRSSGRKYITLCSLAFLTIFSLLGLYCFIRYSLLAVPINVELLEAQKCPGCVGQSACPAFFRKEVFLASLFSTLDSFQPSHFAFHGIEVTIGLFESRRRAHLRRVGSPATPQNVDAAVCRRGLPHGFSQASEAARRSFTCIPYLAIWRWRPTNDPVDGEDGDPVNLPLHHSMVSAPRYTHPESSDSVETEDAWAKRVMPIAYAPATRCASSRLFQFLQSRFRERTSFGATTKWLRFDELMFLFNLAVDPQAVIWQAFPRLEFWPFPTYLGACGRWTLQDYHGVPLGQFCGAPLWLRLRILQGILDIPARLEQKSQTTEGYSVYLGNFELGSLFTVDPDTLNVTVSNLRHAILVDRQPMVTAGVANHVVAATAHIYVVDGISSHACEGNSTFSGDSGGTTPPCLARTHADDLCAYSQSDHNYWAVCTALLHGFTGSDLCAAFLQGMPQELISAVRQCVQDSTPGARRVALEHAKMLASKLSEEYAGF